MKKIKTLGQVFTPNWIVNEILDLIGYNNESILDKYILEPSSGDGVFLLEIVKRYVDMALSKGIFQNQITENLERYIHGIELDTFEYNKSINNLNSLIKLKLGNDVIVNWNIHNINTLDLYTDYLLYFDFVVGNPPYVRIHNLDIKTRNILKKDFIFSEGTIDIYLSFFEMGLKMMKSNGVLGFITPNSYLHNSSYSGFRKYLKEHHLVQTLIDFKANKLFKGFSTYTAITILNKSYDESFFVYKELVDGKINTINQVFFNNLNLKDWSFSDDKDTLFLKQLNENKKEFIKDYFDVQYGFATLRDKIFIDSIKDYDADLVYFNNHLIEKDILKKIIKGSTFKGSDDEIKYIFFPYYLSNKRYIPIEEDTLAHKYPYTYQYLLNHKEELMMRDIDKGALWYEFGRSQGVQSIHNEKIVMSTLMNGDIKYYKVPSDVLMYSGLYIIKNKAYSDWSIVENVLNSEEFYKYIRITGKDFSGGYKSITSKQIKEYRINTSNSFTLF